MERREFLKGTTLALGLAASPGLLKAAVAQEREEPKAGERSGQEQTGARTGKGAEKGVDERGVHPGQTRAGDMLYRPL